MRSLSEVVSENEASNNLKPDRQTVELYGLSRNPFPASRAQIRLLWIIKLDLVPLFEPILGRHLHQLLQEFLVGDQNQIDRYRVILVCCRGDMDFYVEFGLAGCAGYARAHGFRYLRTSRERDEQDEAAHRK